MQKQSKNWPGVQYPLNKYKYLSRGGCQIHTRRHVTNVENGCSLSMKGD